MGKQNTQCWKEMGRLYIVTQSGQLCAGLSYCGVSMFYITGVFSIIYKNDFLLKINYFLKYILVSAYPSLIPTSFWTQPSNPHTGSTHFLSLIRKKLSSRRFKKKNKQNKM